MVLSVLAIQLEGSGGDFSDEGDKYCNGLPVDTGHYYYYYSLLSEGSCRLDILDTWLTALCTYSMIVNMSKR